MKKAISVLVVLTMLLSLTQAGLLRAFADTEGDYEYTVTGGEAKITGYLGAGGNLVLPEYLGTYPVVAIGNSAFYLKDNITSVTISRFIRTVGNQAFSGCSNLTQFSVAAGNTWFTANGGVLFNAAEDVLVVYPGGKAGSYFIADGVTTISSYAFEHCGLLTSVFLNDVTSIGTNAFYRCNALSSVAIPAGIASIGNNAFADCDALTQINVDSGNTVYSSLNGVLFNEERSLLICCPAAKSGEYTVPAGVTEIERYAFFGCAQLTGVTLQEGVLIIDVNAFLSCTALLWVELPDSLVEIRNSAFFSCLNLTQVYIPPNVHVLQSSAFRYCSALRWAFFLGNAPAEIGVNVFDGCHASFKVYYLSTNSGFSNPWQGYPTAPFEPSLSADPVTPTNGNVIVTAIFPPMASLKGYRINGGSWQEYTGPVTMNENGVLYAMCQDVKGNQSPEVSVTVSNIDRQGPAAPEITADPTQPTTEAVLLTVASPPDAVSAEYKIGGGLWQPYTIPFKLTDNDTVYARCFDEAGNVSETASIIINYINFFDYDYIVYGGQTVITGYHGAGGNVVIPDTLGGCPVVAIDDSAFNYCGTLTSVVIPATVLSIGTEAFYRCEALTSVSLPQGLLKIYGAAFAGCLALTKVEFPAGLEELNDSAFFGCESLQWAYFTGPAPAMGTAVFDDCAPEFYVWYLDGNGFDDPWYYKTMPFEPELSASPTTPTNGNVTVTIQYPAPAVIMQYKIGTGAWTGYSAPVVLAANAAVYARCFDQYENVSRVVEITVSNIDKVPPAAPSFSAWPEFETTLPVTVTIAYPADAVAKQYALETAKGPVWVTYTGPVTVTENGIVYARCYDAAGNVSAVAQLNVDNIITVTEGIIEKSGKSTVIDRKANFIYGLTPGIAVHEFESDWVETVGHVTLAYDPEVKTLGTGTRVDVLDDFGVVLESYYIVIFGDVNGDSNIDTGDAGLIVDYENFLIPWDPIVDAAVFEAADVNGDGNIDTGDAGIIVDVENFLLTIDQTTGLAS